MFLTHTLFSSASVPKFPRQFFPPVGFNGIDCRSLFFLLVHAHTSKCAPPRKAYLHHRLWNTRSPSLLLSGQSDKCERGRERERGWAFVISDPETERAVESLTGLMDISTWSHEESRKHHRKCLRGCVMLSLITAHVAPALCILMWWEKSGGFCTFGTQDAKYTQKSGRF